MCVADGLLSHYIITFHIEALSHSSTEVFMRA